MERVLLDEVIETDYGQFDIVWAEDGGFDGDWDRFFEGQINGLVGAADPDGLYVNLARRSGGSPVRIVLTEKAPEMADWEDIVEVSVSIPMGSEVMWMSWAGASSGWIEALEPGNYRVRVSERGRDAGHDGEFAAAWSMPTWFRCGQRSHSRTRFCGREAPTPSTGTGISVVAARLGRRQ